LQFCGEEDAVVASLNNPHPRPGFRAARPVLIVVGVALSAVLLAPVLLSSQDLYRWASDPHGLGLVWVWPLLVPVAFDLAAIVCIGMTIVALLRRDRPGVFGLLVWVFAGVSAYAQYTHGEVEKAAGGAQDVWWAMPTVALLGPLLLEATLRRLRRWARQDATEILTGAAGFGLRWLVAPWSTLSAWATSRREGIASAPAALAFVAERRALGRMPGVEALHYAFGAAASLDPHTARAWLLARGVTVTQAHIDTALAHHKPTGTRPAPAPSTADTPESGESGTKRQPSAAERVIRAVARTPHASDAQIAAKLGLSEQTVRRHRPRSGQPDPRQQADDSLSSATPSARPPAGPGRGTRNAGADAAGEVISRPQAVVSLSSGDHDSWPSDPTTAPSPDHAAAAVPV
jgi:hypothetical protein